MGVKIVLDRYIHTSIHKIFRTEDIKTLENRLPIRMSAGVAIAAVAVVVVAVGVTTPVETKIVVDDTKITMRPTHFHSIIQPNFLFFSIMEGGGDIRVTVGMIDDDDDEVVSTIKEDDDNVSNFGFNDDDDGAIDIIP